MRKLPIFYQVFVYVMAAMIVLLLSLFVITNQIVPSLYETLIQNEMDDTIDDIQSVQTLNPNTIQSTLEILIRELPYELLIFNQNGEGIYQFEGNRLTVSTIIQLNEGPIEEIFFNGNRAYFTRIEFNDEWIIQTSFDVESFYQLIKVINQSFTYLSLLAFLISIVLSLVISKTLTSPITRLTKSVQSNHMISKTLRHDEIGILTNAIHTYQNELNALIQKLEIEIQREKSQDQLTKTFIANVSHEIQTPLSIMLIALETLEDSVESHDYNSNLMQTIKSEIKHLEHLTKDMMVLSTHKTTVLALSKSTRSLQDLLTEVKNELSFLYPNVEFIMDFSHEKTIVHVDQSKFKQVLYNVMNNAIIHQKNSKQVWIQVSDDNDVTTLKIHNKGSNLSPQDRPHIFDTFYKVNSKGSGLGLAIVKTILDAHALDYDIYNEHQGVSFEIIWRKQR